MVYGLVVGREGHCGSETVSAVNEPFLGIWSSSCLLIDPLNAEEITPWTTDNNVKKCTAYSMELLYTGIDATFYTAYGTLPDNVNYLLGLKKR